MLEKFQFTPLREGRHIGLISDVLRAISIHAPPRGATRPLLTASCVMPFQFTPLREGRPIYFFLLIIIFVFQFTPLREGRRGKAALPGLAGAISIHAPPRGATITAGKVLASVIFQFTPLREGRRRGASRASGGLYFNSRPSARGDGNRFTYTLGRALISIHAPPRGATAVVVICA